MITIIAQSKKIARVISYVLNADNDFDGYFAGEKYLITWTYGQMVEIETPRGRTDFWQRNASFPHLPDKLPLQPAPQFYADENAPNQLNVVKRLIARSEKVIMALDPTLRGELMIRYMLRYLECDKPVYRAVLNDLMNTTISQAIYRPEEYDPDNTMAKIAELTDKTDWLFNANLQRAIAYTFGMAAFPVTRSSAYLLGKVAKREETIKNYEEKTWIVPTVTFKDKTGEVHTVMCETGYDAVPEEVTGQLKAGATLKAVSVARSKKPQQAPRLFNILHLQAEAASRYGFEPYKTYKIARNLYENKRISFPGVSNGGVPRRKYDEIKVILKDMLQYKLFSHIKEAGYKPSYGKHVKNDAATTHGIVVTGFPEVGMTDDEIKIYFLIVERMFMAFTKPSREVNTRYEFTCGEVKFLAYRQVINDPGFRKCYRGGILPDNKPEITVEEGDELVIQSVGSMTHKDKKPEPFNDKSLIKESFMCRAGNFRVLAPMEIGFLVEKGYLNRNLVGEYSLTESGRVLHSILKNTGILDPNIIYVYDEMITDAALGHESKENYIETVKKAVKNLTKQLLTCKQLFKPEATSIKCPHCGSKVKVFSKIAECSNPKCGFHLFRHIQGVVINQREIHNLLASGTTTSIRGFIGANGRPFTGRIILETDGSPTVVPVNTK